MSIKLKQINGRVSFGRIKVVFSRLGAYVGYVNFAILLMTFYSVKGYKYAPLWLYIVITIAGILCLGLFDYLIVMPCEIAFQNEQAVKHQNPIYNEIEKINKSLEQIQHVLSGRKQ
ncbi:hypothetical protein B6U67_01820 [Methanosarcinales archaeon ex4484_138]|nr:MAG: hypothetical protein B6U67_01820 [Methanosarcinales archaeon ex4484_138]